MPRTARACKAAACELYDAVWQLTERGHLQCELSSTEGAVYFVPAGSELDPSYSGSDSG